MSTNTAPEVDAEALKAAIDALAHPDNPDDYDTNLVLAGVFVARFGALGDVYEEPHLSRLQFAGHGATGLSLLGHWSVERADPTDEPPPDFERHQAKCETCNYLEKALGIRTTFDYERCHECGMGVLAHTVTRDPIGNPFAACPVWERREPPVMQSGDIGGDVQVSDSFDARWFIRLMDGTWALVTSTYYRAKADGRTYMERQDEYLVCGDLNDPGGTEIASEVIYHDITAEADEHQEDTWTFADPAELAADAAEPNSGDWDDLAELDERSRTAVADILL